MIFGTKRLAIALSAAALMPFSSSAAEGTPDFQEIYGLIQTNIASMGAVELNKLAVEGLLQQLDGRVSLVSVDAQEPTPTEPAVAAAKIFDEGYGYIRLARIDAGTGEQFTNACHGLMTTNQLKGLVLDLRFARGQDYQAAAMIADYFFSSEEPMFQLAGKMMRSTAKEKAFPYPVTILVNSRTRNAAETIAAVMRFNKIGLVIGSQTSGQAVSYREYPLSNGEKLRIATGSVRLGPELQLLHKGVEPDIKVQINQQEERAYLDDPYKVFPYEVNAIAATENNTPEAAANPRRVTSEAELVRRHRESQGDELLSGVGPAVANPPPADVEAGKPQLQLRDPALVRALDLLKGLALLKTTRPS